jgi:putative sigma-54 modulation protein
MQIRVWARHVDLAADLVTEADQLVRRAVSRLARRVSAVAVRLFDVNGPRGGVDKVCEVTVTLDRAGSVHYRAVAPSAAGATRLAVSGIREAMLHCVALRRDVRRRRARRRQANTAN